MSGKCAPVPSESDAPHYTAPQHAGRYAALLVEATVLAILHFWIGVAIGLAVDHMSRAMSPPPDKADGAAVRKGRLAGELMAIIVVIVLLILAFKVPLDHFYLDHFLRQRKAVFGDHVDIDTVTIVGTIAITTGISWSSKVNSAIGAPCEPPHGAPHGKATSSPGHGLRTHFFSSASSAATHNDESGKERYCHIDVPVNRLLQAADHQDRGGRWEHHHQQRGGEGCR